MLPVSAAVLNTLAVAVLVVPILGLAPFMVKLVALGKDSVGLLICVDPVDAPIATVVAAPNALTVNKLVLNSVNVPVLELATVGLTPLMFKVVALPNVTVALLIVVVPVAAPIATAVAAPNAFTLKIFVFSTAAGPVVAVVAIVGAALLRFKVALLNVTVALAMVVVPALAAPMFN